jgi:threonine/homoserine/homoserine lactone efflux protein
VTAEGVSPVLAGFGIGLALAGAPGPVQAVLLAEAHRGGMARGFRAMAGANLTFGLLLLGTALGFSVTPPSSLVARILRVAGGSFLLWLAAEGFGSQDPTDASSPARRASPPLLRGALAVLLNPGAWLFLGTVGTSLLSTAARHGREGSPLLAALALLTGVAIGDGALVVFGGLGLRRADARVGAWVRRALAALLALLGLWLLVGGLIP